VAAVVFARFGAQENVPIRILTEMINSGVVNFMITNLG